MMIKCDNEGCEHALMLNADITERQSVDVAIASGWHGRMGASRAYHYCPKHSPSPTEKKG